MYNMSILDGILRMIIGSIIGGICGAYELWIGLTAPYFIVTGLGGYCPLYHLLGWSTLEDPETNAHHSEPLEAKTLNINQSETKHAA